MADDPEDGVDALARLRAANPVPPAEVAALTTTARARALRAEIVMQTESRHDHDTPHPTGAAPRWQRPMLAGLAVVLLAVTGTALAVGLGGRDTDPGDVVADSSRVDPEAVGDDVPSDTGDPLPDEEVVDPMPGGMAMCVAVYGPETLVEREFAFAGTLTAVDGDRLVFDVAEVFRGDIDDPVTLGGAEFLTTPNPDTMSPIAVGERLLVAGDGGFAWGCGFTQPYDESVAATWRDLLAD